MSNEAKYVPTERLGVGPTCDVFIGRDVGGLNRRVAIKQLREESRINPGRREAFFTAAERWSQLRHDGLVTLFDLDRAGGSVIYEPHPQTAGDKIAGGTTSPDTLRTLLLEAADALNYLHEQRLLHMNIKPSNMLFDAKGHLKLIDGLCCPRDEIGELPVPSGGHKYLSPEVVDPGLGTISPGTDVYCLGFVFLEMLLGPTFDEMFRGMGVDAADADRNWIRWHGAVDEPLPNIAEKVPGLPPTLERVLARMLNKNPLQRYHSAAEIIDDLKAGGAPAAESPVTGAGAAAPGPRISPAVRPRVFAQPTAPAEQPKFDDIPNRPASPIVIRFIGCDAEMVGLNKDFFRVGSAADCDVSLPQALRSNGNTEYRFARGADGWRVSGPEGRFFYLNQEIVSTSANLRSGDIIRNAPGGGGLQFTILNQNSESLAKLAANYAPRLVQAQPSAAPARPASDFSPAPRAVSAAPTAPAAAPPPPPKAAPPAAPAPPKKKGKEAAAVAAPPRPSFGSTAPAAPAGAAGPSKFKKLLDYKNWDKQTKNWATLIIGLATLAIVVWQWPMEEEKPTQKPPAVQNGGEAPKNAAPTTSNSTNSNETKPGVETTPSAEPKPAAPTQ